MPSMDIDPYLLCVKFQFELLCTRDDVMLFGLGDDVMLFVPNG
jgi:hypothetical protein